MSDNSVWINRDGARGGGRIAVMGPAGLGQRGRARGAPVEAEMCMHSHNGMVLSVEEAHKHRHDAQQLVTACH